MAGSKPREWSIERLPDHVVDMIKAGEVIERPSSVVKELFENAVDAGATDVAVELLDGGRALVRVIDDGGGIPPGELAMALQRHATSKLRTPEDLLEIGSFGFRGEALASIASVGRLTLRSRIAEEELGREIAVENGVASDVKSVAAPVGTCLTLKDLFHAVPVRQKFLKSTATEFSHAQDYLLAMALAYPRVGVRLSHNGREAFRFPAVADLAARFKAMHKETASEFVAFRFERGSFRVEGFAGLPETARPVPRVFLTFVNGRLVKDKTVRAGVLGAYSGLVLKGLLPSAVVFVTLDPSRVDVNAHPAKTEIRFEDPLVVEDLVTVGIQSALKDHVSRRMLKGPETPSGSGAVAAASFAGAKFDRGANIIEQASLRAGASSPPASSLGSTRKGASASRFEGVALDPSGTESPAFDARSNSHHQPRAIAQKETYKATSSVIASTGSQPQDTLLEISRPTPFAGGRSGGRAGMTANVNSGALGNAHYLGQYLNCYLLFQSEGDLLVVDQHAFHERILYEELSDASRTEAIARQQLLAPILVPVPRTLVGPALEALPAFHRLGFTVEALNDGHLAVHAFPAFLPASRAAAVFDEILARVVALTDLPESEVHPLVLRARGAKAEFASLGVHERSLEAPAVYHLLHATMACHAAVRAGDPLGEELVRRLVARGSDVDFFAHCPHGRPVYRRLTEKDVAEWFMRI